VKETMFLGIDIGTSSSKGVLVNAKGELLKTAARSHQVHRPRQGHVEMDPDLWWDEFISITRELLAGAHADVAAVGVSGMGPCVVLTGEDSRPLRPGILYGIDTRATAQIDALNSELGREAIVSRCGSELSSQATGPKIRWIAENEPELYSKARRVFTTSSWLVFNLTDEYILDHHSASQSVPLYDLQNLNWHTPWTTRVAAGIQMPELLWPGDVAGQVTSRAAQATGLPVGTPVIAGTVDAWAEAIGVGAQDPGDLMLMYGTTMFLVNTTEATVTAPGLWTTVGAARGTRSLAAGMATSGAITGWIKDLVGTGYGPLLEEAASCPAGADGLLMLPYFAGERTPIQDPDARGTIVGLTLSHQRGHIYRAALEATAFGVRHNIEAMMAAGTDIKRVIAVGGGTTGSLWTQIVSDVTGLRQELTRTTIGASYGAAYLAAGALSAPDIAAWNPVTCVYNPDERNYRRYEKLYGLYRELYPATRTINQALARMQRDS
jgi:xylulokinase